MKHEFTTRVRAFTGEPVKSNRVAVDESGRVYVWDSVAGHFTTCNAISDSAARRIRREAAGR